MAVEKKKEGKDNINSLCKKYFTPELCEESVLESKSALKYKLEKQLILFSRYIWGKTNYKNLELPTYYFENASGTSVKVYNAVLEEATGIAIGVFFEKCKQEKKDSYSAYYDTIFRNELQKLVDEEIKQFTYVSEKVKEDDKILSWQCEQNGIESNDYSQIKKIAKKMGWSEKEFEDVKKWRQYKNPISLDIPKYKDDDEDEDSDGNDFVEDKTINVEENAVQNNDAEEKFKLIEKCFRMKKRNEWHKTVITQRLYDDLHYFFDTHLELSLESFTFIDNEVYNRDTAPSQIEIAEYLGKPPEQLTRLWQNYVSLFRDCFKKEM